MRIWVLRALLTIVVAIAGCGSAGTPATKSTSPGPTTPPTSPFPTPTPTPIPSPSPMPLGIPGTFKSDIRRPNNPSENFGSITINAAGGSAGDSQIAIQNVGFADPAVANATYAVRFCPFVPGSPLNCIPVTQLTTDPNGTGTSKFTFPSNGALAGIFFLSRNGSDEFETMFQEDGADSSYMAKLQPFASLGIGDTAQLGIAGSDSLMDGNVLHHDVSFFRVSVTGAMGFFTYNVSFCPFGGGSGSCISLGALNTDAVGNGTAEVQFPSATGGPFRAGSFAVSRGGSNQFLSGFFISATPSIMK